MPPEGIGSGEFKYLGLLQCGHHAGYNQARRSSLLLTRAAAESARCGITSYTCAESYQQAYNSAFLVPAATRNLNPKPTKHPGASSHGGWQSRVSRWWRIASGRRPRWVARRRRVARWVASETEGSLLLEFFVLGPGMPVTALTMALLINTPHDRGPLLLRVPTTRTRPG